MIASEVREMLSFIDGNPTAYHTTAAVRDILLKADKMSMANSLELRVPFLDKEVMGVAERIPTRYRVTRTR